MNKILPIIFCCILIANQKNVSTTAIVTVVGASVKASQVENTKKYKRSECPVCDGKGWYISGDKITKVDCGYCEPDTKEKPELKYESNRSKIIYHR